MSLTGLCMDTNSLLGCLQISKGPRKALLLNMHPDDELSGSTLYGSRCTPSLPKAELEHVARRSRLELQYAPAKLRNWRTGEVSLQVPATK